MEVDLICADVKLAIELDGGQHLADANAYRRDRRKDRLLQEHGYFVLRFLAEDVGKRLDDLLDAILRALSHAQSLQLQIANWRPARPHTNSAGIPFDTELGIVDPLLILQEIPRKEGDLVEWVSADGVPASAKSWQELSDWKI